MRTGVGRFLRLHTPTNDRRIVHDLTADSFPLPVTMQGENTDTSFIVGKVTGVEFFPHTWEAFASIEVIEPWAVEAVERSQHYLEMDIDRMEYDDLYFQGRHAMEIRTARLRAIRLGTNPCWEGLEFRMNPAPSPPEKK